MIANLERQEAELNDEIAQLEADIENGAGDISGLRCRIASLEDQLESTGQQLADKRLKLRNADRQLAELQKELLYIIQHIALSLNLKSLSLKDKTRIDMHQPYPYTEIDMLRSFSLISRHYPQGDVIINTNNTSKGIHHIPLNVKTATNEQASSPS